MGIAKTTWILELADKLSAPMRGIKAETDKAAGGMMHLQNTSGKAMGAIQTQMPGVGGAIGMLANPYMLAAAGAAALGAGLIKSVKMANDWREGLAKVNVTAQLTQSELAGLSSQLLKIGRNNIAPIESIPEAFNKIISAGLDVKTSLQVLDPSLKAAKAGFSDVGDTAKAAVAVMNSSGENINKVYDVLFATLNKGNAEFQDIAQYLPKLIPMARNAGFALEETAGAWAYLTAQGQTSERATTLAQNAMKALADPKRIESFKQMGINLYDTSGKIKPLTSIIDVLAEKTQGLSDLDKANFFAQLGVDQEAASFFAVASQDAQKFKETIDFATNSQGQLNEAYKNSMTPMDRWRQILNIGKGYMIELGQKALPIMSMLGEKVFAVVKYFQDLYEKSALFRDILSVIGSYLGWVFKMSLKPIVMVFNMFKHLWSIIDSIINKIPGMSGGIEGFYLKVKPYIIYIRDLFGGLSDIMYKIMTFDFKGAYDSFKAFKLPSMEEIRVKLLAEEKERTETKDQESGIKTEITGGGNGPSPKLTPTDLNSGAGSGSSELTGSGSSSIKNITQRIDMKNYFTISSSGVKSEIDSIAEQVVRALNDKLRDGMVAVS